MDICKLKELIGKDTIVIYQNIQELQSILSAEKELFSQVIAMQYQDLSSDLIEQIRLRFIGKKSPLQELLKSFKNLKNEERKNAGQQINELKELITSNIQRFLDGYLKYSEEKKLEKEKCDLTMPLLEVNIGTRHPVSATLNQLINSLRRDGFTVVDGPEIEHDFYNFEALNQPKDHPAREMQDTMFLTTEWLLRTQTSNVQTHALIERGVPLKIVCPGYVYRRDYDMTHIPCFRQVECLVIDTNITMSNMRYTIDIFLKEVFGRPVKTRFRASYFPFTEPSAELDIECQQCFGKGCRSCKGTGWSELGGCGMVNRNVLSRCNIDPDKYQGFAFGFGVDRIAMSKYGIPDLRSLFEGDITVFSHLSI